MYLIQGLTPRDFDIVVSGAPRAFAEEIATRLGGRFFVLGKDKFTVFCVATPEAQIDIMAYKGPDIQTDLNQRDFTINALACRLSDGRLIDVTGGREDLRRRVVRMVSPRVFQDDPVRLVRAFRMAAILNFHIDAETMDAIKSRAVLLQRSAAERIWAELRRILAVPCSSHHVSMMHDSNVLSSILPELVEPQPDHRDRHPGADGRSQWLRVLHSLETVLVRPEAFLPPAPAGLIQSLNEESRVLLKMAALLQNIGKPRCRSIDTAGRIHYHGHAARGAELARAIGKRLRMSNRHREWIATLIRRHQRPLLLFRAGKGRKELPPGAVGRFFRQCGPQAPHLLTLSLADSMADRFMNPKAITEFLIHMLKHYTDKIGQAKRSPLLNGEDLINKFNLPPSPVFGTLLRRVEELNLEGVITDREQALRWVAGQLKKNTPRPTAGGV